MIYIIIGFILFLFSLFSLLSIRNEKSNSESLFVIIALILLSLLSGLRGSTGGDYEGYLSIYNETNSLGEFLSGNFSADGNPQVAYEFLFFLLVSIVKTFSGGLTSLFLVCNLIYSYFLYKILYFTKKPIIFIFFYYLCLFPLTQMWYIRQGLASVILLYGFLLFIHQKKKKTGLAFIIISLFFHFSNSIILPVLLILYNIGIQYSIIGIIIAYTFYYLNVSGTFLILNTLGSIFENPMIDRYIDYKSMTDYGASIKRISVTIYAFTYIIFMYKLVFSNFTRIVKLYLSYMIALVIIVVFFWDFALVSRFMVSFFFGIILITDHFISANKMITNQRFLFILFTFVYSFYSVYNYYLDDSNRNLFFPYKSFFSQLSG